MVWHISTLLCVWFTNIDLQIFKKRKKKLVIRFFFFISSFSSFFFFVTARGWYKSLLNCLLQQHREKYTILVIHGKMSIQQESRHQKKKQCAKKKTSHYVSDAQNMYVSKCILNAFEHWMALDKRIFYINYSLEIARSIVLYVLPLIQNAFQLSLFIWVHVLQVFCIYRYAL